MKQKIKIDSKTEYVVYSNEEGGVLKTSNHNSWYKDDRDKEKASINEQGDYYHVKVGMSNMTLYLSEVAELYYLLKARRKALGIPSCKVK
jgi:hypothetical protein